MNTNITNSVNMPKTYKDIKIWLYVLCYNEMYHMPYIIEYWKRYADKVIVYDNESTDGSAEYLSQFNWIEVRTYVSNNELNDAIYLDIKNNAWKEAKQNNVDFVIVGDFDEVLYSKYNIKEILFENMQKDVWQSQWYNMITLNEPTLKEGELLHQFSEMKIIKNYNNNQKIVDTLPKMLLFNVQTIKESNFGAGAHFANFKKFDNSPIQFFNNDDMCIFHFNYIGIEHIIKKHKRNEERRSHLNKINGWGYQYAFSAERIKNDMIITYNDSTEYSKNIY